MKITNFSHHEHRLLSDAVKKALAGVEAEFGVKFDTRGGNIGSLTGMIRLHVEVVPEVGVKPAGQVEFEAYARRIGLEPSDYGKTFRSAGSGKEFRITGILLGGRKYDLLAEEVHTRKGYKFQAASIVRQLRNQEKMAA